MTTRRDDMAWIGSHLLLLLMLLLPILTAGFGNEYVHIKVHVPKEESPAEEPSHKVIHHFHHHPHPHQLLRSRANRPRPKPSPLLESVILSDLDKPQHMSEHAEYLNHAKELADHLAETYAKKPPPPPPKKKVNTYTIIEEQHRPHGYDYEDHHEPAVETYRVIESRPKQSAHHHHHHHQHLQEAEEEDYHYAKHHLHHSSLGIGAYAEPAPVEEHVDHQETDSGYSYSPPSHAYIPPSQAHRSSKSNRVQPAYTLEAPQESSSYGYDYSRPSSSASGSSSDFRPSVQVPSSSDPYGQQEEEEEEPVDTYAPPPPRRRPRPSSSLVDWPESKGFNSAAAETYSGVDSYNVGHVQGYQYSGPYL
ncbi:atrophin-1 [Drosophila takahashii]|uniref:atrophin-1 n=1 Tax=Drosophila takahashii TaxID=29030 RepID=UPI001CF7F090|nr:polycomb group protein Pc [Drosophila takahashii]